MTPDSSQPDSGTSWRAAWLWALGWWLLYSVVLIGWAATISGQFPHTAVERSMPVWPPTAPLDAWLARVVLWSQARYDVFWYIGIAEQGYAFERGGTAFHPLYPLLTGLLGRLLGGQYLLAAWLIAQVCCVAMLTLLYRLVLLDYDVPTARRTVWFLLGSPLGFSFLIPYTESLLLLGVIGAIYAARMRRWWLAGIAGAVAALTKQPGTVVLLVLLWELWQQQGAQIQRRNWRVVLQPLAALALIPAALVVWLIYRASLGDVAFTWNDPGSILNQLLVTPEYEQVWGEYFSWPWVNLLFALERLQTNPSWYLTLHLVLMLVMTSIALVALWRQRRSYAILTGIWTLMNLMIVYPQWPYMSVIRRFTVIFPLFIQLAVWGRYRLVRILVPLISLLLWLIIVMAYVRLSFVP